MSKIKLYFNGDRKLVLFVGIILLLLGRYFWFVYCVSISITFFIIDLIVRDKKGDEFFKKKWRNLSGLLGITWYMTYSSEWRKKYLRYAISKCLTYYLGLFLTFLCLVIVWIFFGLDQATI